MVGSVTGRIAEACRRVGRDPATVTLVAVTKGRGVEEIRRRILDREQTVLGESRIQEWRSKSELLDGAGIEWHLIGNLQRNKVKYCLPFRLIHSLNSARLADQLQRFGERHDHLFRVLVEVNLAGEESKLGASSDVAERLVELARGLPNLRIEGLMTMAPHYEDAQRARPIFAALRELRDRLGLVELSMGMSNDFEVAIEEGATIVRVGSALFEGEGP